MFKELEYIGLIFQMEYWDGKKTIYYTFDTNENFNQVEFEKIVDKICEHEFLSYDESYNYLISLKARAYDIRDRSHLKDKFIIYPYEIKMFTRIIRIEKLKKL